MAPATSLQLHTAQPAFALVLKNQDKVDQAAIDNDEDLKGSFLNAGQFRSSLAPVTSTRYITPHRRWHPKHLRMISKEIALKQGNIVSRFIKTIADIFVRSSRCWSVAVC